MPALDQSKTLDNSIHEGSGNCNMGALIYHPWKARNLKQFKGETVNKELVVAQIQQEINKGKDRSLEMFKESS